MIALLLALQSTVVCRTYLLANPAPNLLQPGKTQTIELPPIQTDVTWTEAVPSWNLDRSQNASLTVEARVIYPDRTTKYYSFGTWTPSAKMGQAASVDGQKDEDGTVLTDTLRMVRPGGKIQFRLTGSALAGAPPPKLTRLFVNVADTKADPMPETAAHPAWGLVVDPPQLAQGWYPGGKGLCSPASVSMVLAYWSARVGNKAVNRSVPQVQSAVYDSVYGGTGNWSFNASYAGSQPGLLGFAARLSGMDELESWTAAGVPVVCSVSWYLLHGQPIQPDEEGHLVVLNGFLPTGDPVFNDPGDRNEIRKKYKRADFIAAWNYSRRTVYVITPPKLVPEGKLQSIQP